MEAGLIRIDFGPSPTILMVAGVCGREELSVPGELPGATPG
jgi:hypothetical protein